MSTQARVSELKSIAVVGAGTMGHGIAQVAAMAGLRATLTDVSAEALALAMKRLRANLDKGVKLGKVARSVRDEALGLVGVTTALGEAVAEVDVVIEAVPEKLELKRSIFRQLEEQAGPGALLATDTSSLAIGQIASAVRGPERVVGMHFFNPVPIMKLVEIVRHGTTSEEAVAIAQRLAQRLGKTSIVVTDVPGFASSRLGIALGLESVRMLEDGVATAAEMDSAMKLGYGHPMGPLELTDLIGLDVRLSIAEYLAKELGPSFEPPDLLRRLVGEGHLGRKSGRGFFVWQEGKRVA